ncbi:unnamed protein product [Rhodiola kirilowii]
MGSKEKKRSKKASQGRKKKKDHSRNKKRSSKKLRPREDSYSESVEGSLSSASSSSYSSEEDVKRRQSRSLARKDGKGRKKRARSTSSTSDGYSDSPHAKKRKSSKIKVDMGRKKKPSKKYRKAASLSSKSSGESDIEKSRGGSKKKEMRRRYDKKDKSKRGRKRYRASSSSSSESERKSKRHRSPSHSSLSMSSESERAGKRKRYWSPSGSPLSRSSASSDQHAQDEIEFQNKPITKLNSIIVVATEPDQNTMTKGHKNDLDMMDDERIAETNMVEKGELMEKKKSGTEAIVPVQENEDLESILRRKALENLKKFRGGSKIAEKSDKVEISVTAVKQLPTSENAADQKNIGGSCMKQSLSSVIELVQNESEKDCGHNANDSSKVADLVWSSDKEKVWTSQIGNIQYPSSKNHAETKTGGTKSVQHSKDTGVMIPNAALIADNLNPSPLANKKSFRCDDSPSKDNIISQAGKFSNVTLESDSSLTSQEPLATRSTKELKLSPQECLNATPVPSKCSPEKSVNTLVDEVDPKSVGNIIKESNTVYTAVPNNPSSSPPSTVAGEHVSSDHQGEAEDGSQFQEKTMSVMRGGELVQVSYKVYIPKKAPAVARRRLMSHDARNGVDEYFNTEAKLPAPPSASPQYLPIQAFGSSKRNGVNAYFNTDT